MRTRKKILTLGLSLTGLFLAIFGIGAITSQHHNQQASAADQTIIIDHSSVDLYDDIPQSYIDQVKNMRLNIIGESHSRGYGEGAEDLEAIDNKFATTHGNSPVAANNTLRIDHGYSANQNGSYSNYNGENIWFTNAANQQKVKDYINWSNTNSSAFPIDVIGFGWCWDLNQGAATTNPDPVYNVHWYGSSEGGPEGNKSWGLDAADTAETSNSINMDSYIAATEGYQTYIDSQNQSTKVFFSTGPVDNDGPDNTGERGYQRYLKHQHLRNYITANGGILFDYADILSHNDAGTLATETWSGHDFPIIHPDNESGNGGAHIGENGLLRLGKATWVMMARIAGWDGQPASGDTTAPTVNISYSNTNPTNLDVVLTMTTDEAVQTPTGWTKVSDTEYTLTVTENTNGEQIVTVTDLAGNSIDANYEVTNIDKEAPTATVAYSTTEPTNQDVKVTLTASEAIETPTNWTKLSDTKYKIFVDQNTSGTETVTITDLAGNTAGINYQVANIDKTAPTVTVSYSTTNLTNQNVTVSITANEYLKDISGWNKVTAQEFTKEFTKNKTKTITVKDLADNKTNAQIEITNIDKQKPTITLNGTKKIFVIQNQSFTDPGATCSDNHDDACTVNVSGDTVDTAVVGTYTITYDATDQAGNAATQKTRTVKVSPDSDNDGLTDLEETNYGTDPNDPNSIIVKTISLDEKNQPKEIAKAKLEVKAGMCNHITKFKTVSGNVNPSEKDINVIGGLDFELHCADQTESADVEVTLSDKFDDLTKVRVYKKNGNNLINITEQVTLTNTNGKTVLSYSLSDNGAWDESNTNMVIKDPIYFGIKGDSSLPNTGEMAKTASPLIITSALLIGAYIAIKK